MKNPSALTAQQRISNFEVLRTLAMFSIVLLHCVGFGLATDGNCLFHLQTPITTFNSLLSQFILFATGVGVNIFVMITGYFMVMRTDSWKRIPKLWLQTVFYTCGMTILGVVSGRVSPNLSVILDAVFPIRASTYWFVSQYVGLMLIAPFLSAYLQKLSKQQYQKLLITLLVLNTSFAYFPYGDVYSGGFTLLWFITLFIFSGYIRLFNPFSHNNKFGMYFLLWCISLTLIYFALVYLKTWVVGNHLPMKMRAPLYNSFTFISSLLLFVWAKNKTFSTSLIVKILVTLAPYTFGVYLFHEAKWLRELLWLHWLTPLKHINHWYYLFFVVLSSALVFMSGVVVDSLRQFIFRKFCLEEKFTTLCSNIYHRIQRMGTHNNR